MGNIYDERVNGKTAEELLERLESGEPGSPVFEVLSKAIDVRTQEEAARASRRLASALNWLTGALVFATTVGTAATVWAVLTS